MAKRTIELLTDDLDGTDLKDGEGQTITFAVGRAQYEIDLSDKNVGKFYDALKPYTDAGRKLGRSSSTSSSSPAKTDKEQLQAAREWLRAQGHEVSNRGRIKAELMDLYNSSH